jgi:hypothetical protein
MTRIGVGKYNRTTILKMSTIEDVVSEYLLQNDRKVWQPLALGRNTIMISHLTCKRLGHCVKRRYCVTVYYRIVNA